MNRLIDLPPKSVEYLKSDKVIMIDIRREEEWEATGVIPDAYKITFFDTYGNADVPTWMQKFEKLVTSKDQQFILICAHANRTRVIGDFLIQNHGYTNVTHLKGGMALWLEEERAVILTKKGS
jgi:rhodanese-related sulfurtransferase